MTDAVQAVADRYLEHMKSFPAELAAMGALAPTDRAKALATFAHSVAGTAGSLGFEAVSRAAFALEDEARAQSEGAIDVDVLDARAAALLDAIPKIAVSA